MELRGSQRKYLRGLAHALRPAVQVGREGLSAGVLEAFHAALAANELVKVQFLADKDRDTKRALAETLAAHGGAALVGAIGHTAIFFRRHPDPERRRVRLPGEEAP